MWFSSIVPLIAGSTDPDPIATPGSVPTLKLVYVPPRPQSDVDEMTMTALLAFPGTAGDTATVTIWAIDSDSLPQSPNPMTILFTPAQIAALRYYRLANAVVVTANIIPAAIPMAGGWIYVQQTADTLTDDTSLRISPRS